MFVKADLTQLKELNISNFTVIQVHAVLGLKGLNICAKASGITQ